MHREFLIWLLFLTPLLLPEIASASSPDIYNREQLESFTDGVMFTSMQTQGVVGAVVSVVADGELLFSKGYGYSDVEKKHP